MSKYYVHGVSYVDERLMMYNDDLKQPYYYALERMYSVWAMIDRTGAPRARGIRDYEASEDAPSQRGVSRAGMRRAGHG